MVKDILVPIKKGCALSAGKLLGYDLHPCVTNVLGEKCVEVTIKKKIKTYLFWSYNLNLYVIGSVKTCLMTNKNIPQ